MSMRISKARRLATGTAAAALAMGTIAIAGPAVAASEPLNYTCTVPILGAQQFVTTMDAPATVPVAGTGALTASVVVPEGLVDSLRGLLAAESVAGDGEAKGTANGVEITSPLTIPTTPVPASGAMTVLATGVVGVPAAVPVGTTLAVAAGDYTVNLTVTNTDGEEVGPLAIPCTLDGEQDNAIGTVTVVQTGSKTKVTAKAKKNKATIKVKVKADTAVSPTGKVKIAVKGKKKVTKTVKVNKKGVAKVVVKKLKKGKYKVNAAYAGDSNVKKSKSKATFKIK